MIMWNKKKDNKIQESEQTYITLEIYHNRKDKAPLKKNKIQLKIMATKKIKILVKKELIDSNSHLRRPTWSN